MTCKHKNKNRLYERLPSTWRSTDCFKCEDCEAILGLKEIKVKMIINKKSLKDQTKDALRGQ